MSELQERDTVDLYNIIIEVFDGSNPITECHNCHIKDIFTVPLSDCSVYRGEDAKAYCIYTIKHYCSKCNVLTLIAIHLNNDTTGIIVQKNFFSRVGNILTNIGNNYETIV